MPDELFGDAEAIFAQKEPSNSWSDGSPYGNVRTMSYTMCIKVRFLNPFLNSTTPSLEA